eukprot:CAMPEP_0179286076 /NCGR_PEP_ID=MMETSP0797-20121207/39549_1 /TAXON_ID=47934 /ORGANISM="Dinophysis acuminata, Strain DAEP01" /LENGTH=94 /DNA_ID=CAMNT_0020994937 /DNA_START=32 /DNA_END=313 /DNA_ORIENTATION=+
MAEPAAQKRKMTDEEQAQEKQAKEHKTAAPARMSDAVKKYLLATPKVAAPLDPGFAPLILGKQKYLEAAKDCKDKLDWALVRVDGCARYTLPVF